MTTRKLLERIKAFFDPGAAESREAQLALREVLDNLKQKERDLRERLAHEVDPEEQRALEQKINLVHSQRSKGLQLLKGESERERSGE